MFSRDEAAAATAKHILKTITRFLRTSSFTIKFWGGNFLLLIHFKFDAQIQLGAQTATAPTNQFRYIEIYCETYSLVT